MISKLFPQIHGFDEIKETILLQLVSNLNILIIGDYGAIQSSFLETIKDNFDWINYIEELGKEEILFQKSVLAYSIPLEGRFNPCEKFEKQIVPSKKTLNRFDIIFVVRDIPEPDKDRKIAEAILNENKPFLEELKEKLARCRNIKTIWSENAKEKLIEFYVDIRNKKESEGVSISPKKLETLKKISEGYAKLSERQKISLEDVEKTIKLFEHYLDQVGNEK